MKTLVLLKVQTSPGIRKRYPDPRGSPGMAGLRHLNLSMMPTNSQL